MHVAVYSRLGRPDRNGSLQPDRRERAHRARIRTGRLCFSPIHRDHRSFCGITSVLLVMMMGQPRIFWHGSRWIVYHCVSSARSIRTGRTPINPPFDWCHRGRRGKSLAANTCSSCRPDKIGTLFAFTLVCASVLILRYVDPHHERPFKCPWSPVLLSLGIVLCLVLMLSLPSENWMRLVIWMIVGLGLYFCYGFWHSVSDISPNVAR